LHVLEGAELGPMALALGMAKFGSLTLAHPFRCIYCAISLINYHTLLKPNS
jgi:hypothetical protein